jgi:hypothetical protein
LENDFSPVEQKPSLKEYLKLSEAASCKALQDAISKAIKIIIALCTIIFSLRLE